MTEEVKPTELRAHPRLGLRCWQFRKSAPIVPTWATEYIYISGKEMQMSFPSGDGFALKDGDWIVVADHDQEAVMHYSNEEFIKLFAAKI